MADLLVETFTGTNGDPWSASWTTVGSQGAGTLADIQSNAGRLVAQHTTYGYISQKCTLTAQADTGLLATVTFADASAEQYLQIMVRGSGAISGTEPHDCLFMQFMVSQAQVEFAKSINYSHTSLDGSNTSWSPTTSPWKIRMEFEGTTARLKWWDAGGSEPGSFTRTATVTDSELASGQVFIAMVSGNSSTARTATIDDVTVYDLASGSSVTGTASVTLGAPTATAAGVPTVIGAASVTLGAPTATASGAKVVYGAAAVTLGAPTATAAGAKVVYGTASVTLGAPTATASGVKTVYATASITLGAPTATAAGQKTVYGTAGVTLAGPTGTAVSGSPQGTATITLGAPTATALGVRTTYGTAAITLGAPTATVAGTKTVNGTAGILLGALLGAGAGVRTTYATASGTLGGPSCTALGVPTVVGAASVTLPGPVGTVVLVSDPNVVPFHVRTQASGHIQTYARTVAHTRSNP